MQTTLLCAVLVGLLGATTACGDVGYALARGAATGLRGGPAAVQQQPAQSVAYEPAPVVVPGCASDYGCAYGERCIKGQYASTGSCAKAVDAYGVQTFAGPRASTFDIGQPGDCSFDTECPVLFACVKLRGDVLTGHCMKR